MVCVFLIPQRKLLIVHILDDYITLVFIKRKQKWLEIMQLKDLLFKKNSMWWFSFSKFLLHCPFMFSLEKYRIILEFYAKQSLFKHWALLKSMVLIPRAVRVYVRLDYLDYIGGISDL